QLQQPLAGSQVQPGEGTIQPGGVKAEQETPVFPTDVPGSSGSLIVKESGDDYPQEQPTETPGPLPPTLAVPPANIEPAPGDGSQQARAETTDEPTAPPPVEAQPPAPGNGLVVAQAGS